MTYTADSIIGNVWEDSLENYACAHGGNGGTYAAAFEEIAELGEHDTYTVLVCENTFETALLGNTETAQGYLMQTVLWSNMRNSTLRALIESDCIWSHALAEHLES